jgi:SNF2 family DNA or RNA helicase
MEIVENKALVLRTRNPQRYGLIPKSKVLGEVEHGLYEVAVHWGLDEARVLKNLGVRNVPSPIMKAYTWPGKYKPFIHQKETSAFLTLNNRAFVFSEPGTAKTMSALWAADYLMTLGLVRRCLVLCPLSIMSSAWMGDLGNSVIHRSAVACHHQDSSRRREMIGKGYEFIIANYDGLPLIVDTLLEDGRFDLIIVDEANAYKNVTTRRWKTLARLVQPNTHLWMMTGTPAAQSPEDAYGLAKLVSPDRVPRFFTAWRDKVMYKATMFKWLPKHDAYTQVHTALQPAIRYTKKECLDLPPVLTEVREVALTAQQLKYYKLMKDRMIMQAAGETITAINAAAGVNKLLQLSAGAAYTDNREVVEFDCTPRLNVLLEVLQETSRKVLVFTMFRHNMAVIEAFLQKHKISCAQINGDVTATKRTAIFKEFQNTDTPKVLIIQPQAAQHGVTLTAADTVVFWGPVMSVESYIQCIARTDRQGQTSTNVTVVHIQGSDIERRMFKRLALKVDSHSMLLKIYEEELAT